MAYNALGYDRIVIEIERNQNNTFSTISYFLEGGKERKIERSDIEFETFKDAAEAGKQIAEASNEAYPNLEISTGF